MAQVRQRNTRQRGAVRDALQAAEGFCSAQDIFATLRAQRQAVGLSTVYRHLQSLVDDGLADVIRTPDGETTYRYCGEAAQGHHHHLVCRQCGRTEEIEGRGVEQWARRVGEEHGFTDLDHTVELFGTCAGCASR